MAILVCLRRLTALYTVVLLFHRVFRLLSFAFYGYCSSFFYIPICFCALSFSISFCFSTHLTAFISVCIDALSFFPTVRFFPRISLSLPLRWLSDSHIFTNAVCVCAKAYCELWNIPFGSSLPLSRTGAKPFTYIGNLVLFRVLLCVVIAMRN